MAKFSFSNLKKSLRVGRTRWLAVRQTMLDGLFSTLYGTPMQVLPKGHAGLAAAVVLWFMQDGQRNVIMVRNPKGRDNRARLVSCLGLASAVDMSVGLRGALESQLGKVFARTIDKKLLNTDRVAAAPVFTYTDDETGISSPVQVLAWVVQIQPVQMELIHTASNLELVLITEQTLDAAPASTTHLSPTHRAIWHSVHRHLPALRNGKGRADGVEEVSMDVGELKKGGVRTVH